MKMSGYAFVGVLLGEMMLVLLAMFSLMSFINSPERKPIGTVVANRFIDGEYTNIENQQCHYTGIVTDVRMEDGHVFTIEGEAPIGKTAYASQESIVLLEKFKDQQKEITMAINAKSSGKIKVSLESGANIHSCNVSYADPGELGFESREEWDSATDARKMEAVKDFFENMGYPEYSWED